MDSLHSLNVREMDMHAYTEPKPWLQGIMNRRVDESGCMGHSGRCVPVMGEVAGAGGGMGTVQSAP